jgi:L-threonylcarbamoyladenylate synthase
MEEASQRISSPDEIAQAAAHLEAGGLVAIPTETVYGLAGDAENPHAVAQIYATKGRPANHPVIVHLSEHADPAEWARELSDDALRLIDAFWPGPLTVIVPRAAHIPAIVSAGQDTIGLRCPAHPVTQALLAVFKGGRGGLAAPSANRFGRVSPTTAQHVRDEFGDAVRVLDGGPCEIGIESTIVDVSRGFTEILRPGRITSQQLAEVLGNPRYAAQSRASTAARPRAPGTLAAHYAPRTPLALLSREEIDQALATLPSHERVALVATAPFTAPAALADRIYFVAAPTDAQRYARGFYALLRNLDGVGVQRILIERLPAGAEWEAVRDRLERAAAAHSNFRVG